jgi:nitrate/TMAO reductase-like tetraheme cytochrome c subunit
MTQDVGSQKCKGQVQMWTEYETWLHSNKRLGVRLIVEELNMNKETVQQIIMEDLKMRTISAKMVPRILTDEEFRFHISSDLLHNA